MSIDDPDILRRILEHAQRAGIERAAVAPSIVEAETRVNIPFADLPPMIIHTLRVLLDRESYPPGHAEWVENGVRAILKNWEDKEDINQLKRDLGLVGKKRRKELTMRRETTIAAAIVAAALAGSTIPKKAAGDELQADEREVQRAWKRWKRVYLLQLTVAMESSQALTEEHAKIRRALEILEPPDNN